MKRCILLYSILFVIISVCRSTDKRRSVSEIEAKNEYWKVYSNVVEEYNNINDSIAKECYKLCECKQDSLFIRAVLSSINRSNNETLKFTFDKIFRRDAIKYRDGYLVDGCDTLLYISPNGVWMFNNDLFDGLMFAYGGLQRAKEGKINISDITINEFYVIFDSLTSNGRNNNIASEYYW